MRRFPVLALWACALGSAAAQSRKEFDSAAYYKKWLEQDVIYIITDEEMAVFKSLTTDEERDQFIEQFWLRRDKTPETAENEYKIEHYRRILYANEKFTAGIPGWKTDRGRIYIMFGPPDRYMSQPQGGSYVRERKEGGGLTSVAPFERWEYRHIDGIGDDVELEFVDDKGGGLYELTFDNQRKDDLLQLGFMGPTLDEIEAYEKLGVKRKQDRVAGRRYAGDLSGDYRNTAGFETHKDAPFQKLQLSAMLNKPPEIRFKDLEAVIGTRISYSAIPVRYDAGYVRISDRQVMVPVTLEPIRHPHRQSPGLRPGHHPGAPPGRSLRRRDRARLFRRRLRIGPALFFALSEAARARARPLQTGSGRQGSVERPHDPARTAPGGTRHPRRAVGPQFDHSRAVDRKARKPQGNPLHLRQSQGRPQG